MGSERARTVMRAPCYQAWLDARRAERELARGRAGTALALAIRAHWLAPNDELPPAVLSSVRQHVASLLPAVDAWEWVAAAQSVEGWLTVTEAMLLAQCVAAAPRDGGQTVLEIGSYRGRSTVLIALTIMVSACRFA